MFKAMMVVALVLVMGAVCAFNISKVSAAETGTLTVVEKATCASNPCPVFFFSGTGGIGDFTLAAVRSNRTPDSNDFNLAPGVYKVTQATDTDLPLSGISCTSDQRRLVSNRNGSSVTVELRAGENIICAFSNDPAPTPTPIATTTPVATATPVPTAAPVATPQTVFVPVPVVQTVVVEKAVTPAPAAVIKPPSTGNAGLKIFDASRRDAAWGDENNVSYCHWLWGWGWFGCWNNWP